MPVLLGKEPYPENVLEKLEERIENLKIINAAETAEKLGNIKSQNIVLLGALIKALGLENMDWAQVVRDNLPEKMHDINIKALKAGMDI
jgi:indolepyruvate ferredoxin oxidoreductase beta subunit